MIRPGSFVRESFALGLSFLISAGLVAVDRALAQPSEKALALRVKTGTAETVYEKALRARTEIKRGDFSKAQEIATEVLAGSPPHHWHFHPFGEFVGAIANSNDPALEKRLDGWVDQAGENPTPRLIRAQYLYHMASFVRGGRNASASSAAELASFSDYLTRALKDASTAAAAGVGDPHAFLLKLRILRAFGLATEAMSVFEQAIEEYPEYYPLYDTVLTMHHPRWGGSTEAMYAFVDQYAGRVSQHSPLKLLYLSLYRHLLNYSAASCATDGSDRDARLQCVARAMQQLVRPELDDSIMAALQLYEHLDKYAFGLTIEEILGEMLRTSSGESHSATILELAARSMGSNTQLRPEQPGHNNYIVDKLVALSWYQKGFYPNALIKSQDAVKSVENFSFPSDVEKDLAVAGIYQALGNTHSTLKHYAEMAAYEDAAVALGGETDREHFICYAHYHLKAYEDAIRACTRAIADQAGNMKAYYWRARVYRDLEKLDDALRDFKAVADSPDSFRATAAIDVSMILFNRKDIAGALVALNRYTYLYQPELTVKQNVAVAYNNRCYAHMELGELMKALEDCKSSLKYGSLPDAYRKQLELTKRLETLGSKF